MSRDTAHDSFVDVSQPRERAKLSRPPRAAPAPSSVDDLAEIFRRHLNAPVEAELNRSAPQATPPASKRAADRPASRRSSGPRPLTFGALLHRPKPPLALLRRVKEYAKAACKDPNGPLPPDAASALYYGVIAAALVHRDERLSTLSDDGIFRGLRWMIGQTWLDDATRDLAQRGLERITGTDTTPPPGHAPAHPAGPGTGDSA